LNAILLKKSIEKTFIFVFPFAVGVAKHELESGSIYLITELLQAHLCIIVKRFFSIVVKA